MLFVIVASILSEPLDSSTCMPFIVLSGAISNETFTLLLNATSAEFAKSFCKFSSLSYNSIDNTNKNLHKNCLYNKK